MENLENRPIDALDNLHREAIVYQKCIIRTAEAEVLINSDSLEDLTGPSEAAYYHWKYTTRHKR